MEENKMNNQIFIPIRDDNDTTIIQMIVNIIKSLIYEINGILLQIITLLPDNRFGIRMRRLYYQHRIKRMGKNLNILSGAIIEFELNEIQIGDNVNINHGCLIAASQGEIIIQNNVLIGPYCVLRSSNHIFSDPNVPILKQGHEFGKIIIEHDVWIGANVVVLPNVRIGKGSVIGAGAVVTGDIEPYSIAVGVPARKIGSRN